MTVFTIIVGCCTILSTIISLITLKNVYDIKNNINTTNRGDHNKIGTTTNTGKVGGNLSQNTVSGDQYNEFK